jgi:hypothetical protein
MRHAAGNALKAWSIALGHNLSPFWLFKDANQGDLFARAAATAHNQRMSDVLPLYLRRWLLVCAVAGISVCTNDALGTGVAGRQQVFALMAACSGLVCTCGICFMMVIGYAWCYLRLGKH